MQTTTLGRTGIETSVVGLGCGGPSRLGQRFDVPAEDSIAVIRRALDLGVRFIDTAENYRTEPLLATALRDVPRQQVVISTKKDVSPGDEPLSAEQIRAGIDDSLQRLKTDYIDIFHLHGVKPDFYDHARNVAVPAMQSAVEQGKIRHLAISERFERDTTHTMLRRALADDCFDVVMVGFNVLNQTARETVFPATQQRGIGTLVMFAVRRALSQPQKLHETLTQLIESGEVDAADIDLDDPLDFAVRDSDARNVTEVAYRFCRHETGADVVLTGTGNIAHLEANIASLQRGPLPQAVQDKIRRIFARATSAHGS